MSSAYYTQCSNNDNNETEKLTISPKTQESCSPADCEAFQSAKSQFQIFVNKNSSNLIPGSKTPRQPSTVDNESCVIIPFDDNDNNINNDENENIQYDIQNQRPTNENNSNHANHANQTNHDNITIPLSPQPLAIDFTQGTTNLQSEHVVSIPDDEYLNENMEYLQHLLYIEPTLSLQELVICVTFLLRNGRQSADLKLIENVLQRYDVNNMDYEQFMYVDSDLQYTRNLIATDNTNWTLLLLVWNPHSQSPVHNHPNCECFVRVLSNQLVEYRYHHPDHQSPTSSSSSSLSKLPKRFEKFEQTCSDASCDVTKSEQTKLSLPSSSSSSSSQLECFSQADCRAGMVTFMNDELGLHKLQNNTDKPALTLHLYFPPYNNCKIYLNNEKVATISNICYHTIRGKQNFFNGLFQAKGTDFDEELVDICSKK